MFDDLRRRYPRFTFNVYAPASGRVQLEIIDADDQVTAFEGATLAACIARAFGAVEPPATVEEIPLPPHGGLFD